MKNTVVIVGSHPKTRIQFDFARTDCDIWLFNEAISNPDNRVWAKRADAIFQMHEEAIWRNPGNRNHTGHCEWLRTQNECDVYMQEKYADIPRAVLYPLDEIVDRFKISYFTSSVAYAIALACLRGYQRMELYGVEMETNTEYQYQRDGVTLWIGIALGLGIEVDLHIGMLEDQPLYGYQGEVVIQYQQFDERIAELMPRIEELSKQYGSALDATLVAVNAFAQSGDVKTETNLYNTVQAQARIGEQLGLIDGMRQENLKYKNKADTMRSASNGEFLFSRQEFESSAKNLTDRAGAGMMEVNSIATTMDIIHNNVKRTAKESPKRKKVMEGYRQFIYKYFQANNQTSIFKGAASENFRYMQWLDKHIRAAGGSKSEAVLLENLQNV